MNQTLSIVIPVFNTKNYIERCLDSVIQQSYKNLEIIIVNDCSTDGVESILNAYVEKDMRIKVLTHEINKGLFQARVTGAQNATGEYITFVDSDDYISIDLYRVMMEKALSKGYDIVAGDTYFQKEDGSIYVRPLFDECFVSDELLDTNVRDRFFEQEYQCFSWHTVWNKIYKMSLWKQCMPVYTKFNQHLIMTEDILFSSVIFYKARSFARIRNNGYFYCENAASSTNSKKMTVQKFCKNVNDIANVFNFVNDFLIKENAGEDIIGHFTKGRQFYSRMWRSGQNNHFAPNGDELINEALNKILPEYTETTRLNDNVFDRYSIEWNSGFENIKRSIANPDFTIISFDVFDTLIKRPFYKPDGLFKLLNYEYDHITGNCHMIDFAEIRKQAEITARNVHKATDKSCEDITLTEIYSVIKDNYAIPPATVEKLKLAEIELEKKYCSARTAGKELFYYARALGKTVILISDMYLEEDILKDILKQSGYADYEHLFLSSTYGKLKHTGGLYKIALSELQIKPECLLHIGDGWSNDIIKACELKINTCFFPSATDSFEGNIKNIKVARLKKLGDLVFPKEASSPCENFVYQIMQKMTADRFFNHAYASFDLDSDLNMNPALIGYYPVGMHLLGVARWLIDRAHANNHTDIYFLARDGYLFKQAVDILNTYESNPVNTHYIAASRKALMPALVANAEDFYSIPVSYQSHTPKTLTNLLSFAMKENQQEYFFDLLSDNNICPEAPIRDKEQFYRIITIFIKNAYDRCKHEEALGKISVYYSELFDNHAAIFDMGYSGRLISAICAVSHSTVFTYYIHRDTSLCAHLEKRYGFCVESFYNYTPKISGMFREHLLSEASPSAIGFKWSKDNIVEPIYEKLNMDTPARELVICIQKNAIQFVKDYVKVWGNMLPIPVMEVSRPFEALLRSCSYKDIHIFESNFFEDEVYGAQKKIDIFRLLSAQREQADRYVNDVNENGYSFFADKKKKRSVFDEARATQIANALRNKPFMYKVARKVYRVAKGMKK